MLEQLHKLIDAIRESILLEKSAAAGIIVVAGLLGGYFLGKIVGFTIRKLNMIEKVRKLGVRNPETYIENIVRYIVYAVAFVFALNRLGLIQTFITTTIIVAIVITLILLTFTFSDVIENLGSGILLHSRYYKLKSGARIKAGNVKGEIKSFGWIETKLQTHKGETVIIPNSFLLKQKLEVETKSETKFK
jgi:small-conductance mechanosensitive channel